jgi:hypothetical protein
MDSDSKPRLLYFNGPWDYLGERLIASYVVPFRRLLDQDFQVVSVEGDCDLRDEVEKHRPDAILFHTGTESNREREVTITRTDAYREIPRMGYMYRDPISPSRIAPMNRMTRWGVDQVFTCNRRSDSPIPFFADSIYVPWWIDDTVFRDYGEAKTYPITLAGAGWLSAHFFYTWRQPIFAQLVLRFPIFHVPVFQNHKSQDAFVGTHYARLLNQSLFAAGCGSANRYLTLKLLEIPASRCCLITEETEVLKAMGFVDGANCVFADEKNVVQKVQALLDDPARLQAITDAGFEMVHRCHTQRQRKVFIEWFRLWKSREAGQRVVQTNPLEPLQIVSENDAVPEYRFPTENPVFEGLHAGYRLIDEAKWSEALSKFESVLAVIAYIAEARLGAGICALHLNNLQGAAKHFSSNLENQSQLRITQHPDVISIAYLAVVLVKQNLIADAVEVLRKSAGSRNPALNSLCWLLAARHKSLKARDPMFQIAEGDETTTTHTLHLLPAMGFQAWAERWKRHLD